MNAMLVQSRKTKPRVRIYLYFATVREKMIIVSRSFAGRCGAEFQSTEAWKKTDKKKTKIVLLCKDIINGPALE